MTRDELAAAVRRGEFSRLQRGWYQPAAADAPPLLCGAVDRPPRLSAVAGAALLSSSKGVAVSGAHAALAWGLPRPLGELGPVGVTAPGGRPQQRGSVRLVVAHLPSGHVTLDAAGLSVTSAARTVLDCARHLPGRDALAIADAALRRGIVDPAELAEAAEVMVRWPGVRRARAVVELADGLREGPLESWSAWSFHELGVPQPRWQVTVVDPSDGREYRLDCLWGERLAGEADGRSKALLRAKERRGATAERLARVLDDERRREARLRALGFQFVRWGARDVLDDVRARRLAELLGRLASAAAA